MLHAKTEIMKHKDEMMEKLAHKRADVEQKVQTAKDDISMKDILKQLSDKHDEAKRMVSNAECDLTSNYKWFSRY